MTSIQHELYDRRTNELEHIGDNIQSLNLSNEWTEVFTSICFYRGWRQLKPHHLEAMQNIAEVNSKHLLHLAQYGKLVGLKLLNRLASDTSNEEQRKKAVTLILEKGVKYSASGIDIILAMKTPSLFNKRSQDE